MLLDHFIPAPYEDNLKILLFWPYLGTCRSFNICWQSCQSLFAKDLRTRFHFWPFLTNFWHEQKKKIRERDWVAKKVILFIITFVGFKIFIMQVVKALWRKNVWMIFLKLTIKNIYPCPKHIVRNSFWIMKNLASDNEGKFHIYLKCRIWICNEKFNFSLDIRVSLNLAFFEKIEQNRASVFCNQCYQYKSAQK